MTVGAASSSSCGAPTSATRMRGKRGIILGQRAPGVATAMEGALQFVANPQDDLFLARLRLRQQMLRWPDGAAADPAVANAEATGVVERIRRDQAGFQHWHAVATDRADQRLEAAATVRLVPEAVAAAICERFHYVGTRREGVAVGMYSTAPHLAEVPATLLLVSPFDLHDSTSALPPGMGTERVLLLSRVYTFRWAPANAFSFCWSRALAILRERFPQAELAVTLLDPNPGFTATSYLATSWIRLAGEHAADYWYLDGQHIMRRELVRRFGVSEPAALQARLGGRLAPARQPILPLELWAYPLRRSLRRPLLRMASMARGV
jgi:hypothetical protein